MVRLVRLLAVLFGMLFLAQAAHAEYIQSFHADIVVDKAGPLTVAETIEISIEHNQVRHGIYRDFPTTFRRDDGTVQRVGSMITLFFTEEMGRPVRRLDNVPASARARFGAFFRGMRDRGVMLPPSQYEAWFISAAHTDSDIDYTVGEAREALAEVAKLA